MPECVWCVHDDDDDGGEEEELERMYFNFLIRMYKMKMRKPALSVLILYVGGNFALLRLTTYYEHQPNITLFIVHITTSYTSEELFATMTNNGTKRSF